MRVCRLWRHLKLLKRAGLHLTGKDVQLAPSGSCAIECPACPHPDVAPRPANIIEEGLHPAKGDVSLVKSFI